MYVTCLTENSDTGFVISSYPMVPNFSLLGQITGPCISGQTDADRRTKLCFIYIDLLVVVANRSLKGLPFDGEV